MIERLWLGRWWSVLKSNQTLNLVIYPSLLPYWPLSTPRGCKPYTCGTISPAPLCLNTPGLCTARTNKNRTKKRNDPTTMFPEFKEGLFGVKKNSNFVLILVFFPPWKFWFSSFQTMTCIFLFRMWTIYQNWSKSRSLVQCLSIPLAIATVEFNCTHFIFVFQKKKTDSIFSVFTTSGKQLLICVNNLEIYW